ncbi:hypothetical protein ES703_65741 [subsurface metagenome]|jgi:hypothetical protein
MKQDITMPMLIVADTLITRVCQADTNAPAYLYALDRPPLRWSQNDWEHIPAFIDNQIHLLNKAKERAMKYNRSKGWRERT